MIAKFLLGLGLGLAIASIQTQAGGNEPLRFWKDLKGRELIGELVACDDVRVTLRVEDNSKKVFPLSHFSAADRAFVLEWRDLHPQTPWIDPATMPAWPRTAGSGVVKVRKESLPEDETAYAYRSPHFEVQSDLDLPLPLAGDIASIFEATRIAVRTLPLGLAASPPVSQMRTRMEKVNPQLKYDPDLLRVVLLEDPQRYARSGAPAGSGGFYNPMANRTVISLANLGIQKGGALSSLDFRKHAFVMKHEITHHLLHDWAPFLPIWFSEGFAEYLGAAPYSQGRYQFVSMDRHLHDYLNKWRFGEDKDHIPVMKTADLMSITGAEWAARAKRNTPILEYNSAAMLVHFFIHHDGAGNAANLAAYLDAIRRGIPPADAANTHLLRNRSFAQLDDELRRVWEKNKVTLEGPGRDPFK
jgi:hypothetical protein